MTTYAEQQDWKDDGCSASAGMRVQYATCAAYPGVSRVTVSYRYEDTHVAYVVSGRTREYKTPERAAWAAVAAGVAPCPLRAQEAT